MITRHFRILPGAEVSLEVDPHITTFEQAWWLYPSGNPEI